MKASNKLALFISIALASVAGNAAAEVTLYDYTEATSAYTDAYVNGQFNITNGNVNDANGSPVNGQTAYNADLSLKYEDVKSTPDRNISTKCFKINTEQSNLPEHCKHCRQRK